MSLYPYTSHILRIHPFKYVFKIKSLFVQGLISVCVPSETATCILEGALTAKDERKYAESVLDIAKGQYLEDSSLEAVAF